AASCHQTLGIDDGADSRLICRLGDVAGPSSVRLTVRSPGRDSGASITAIADAPMRRACRMGTRP
ncbi:MAG: hypothetical protein JWN00_5522, partial [Actinomycetia bacterium]|nr:hypothetical protein [Actinomycetes bacterium]